MAEDWKSYVDLDGTHVHVAANLPTTVDELIEQRGVRPGLLVATAPEAALLTELLAEAWHAADFAARHELVPRVRELQTRIDAMRAVLDRPWPADEGHHDFVNQQVEDARAALQGDEPTEPEAPASVAEAWTCERCGGHRWIGWRAGPAHEGYKRYAQCTPCGHVQALPSSEVPGG